MCRCVPSGSLPSTSVWPHMSCSIRFITKRLSMATCVGVFNPVHYQTPQYGHMCRCVPTGSLPSTSVWAHVSVCSIRFITKRLSMATCVGVFHQVHYQAPQYGHMCRCVPSGSLPSTSVWSHVSLCSIRFITKRLSMATCVGVFHPVHFQSPQYGHMCRCVPSGSLPAPQYGHMCRCVPSGSLPSTSL